MKRKLLFFILLLWCVASSRICYASSEAVFIHDESSVEFHTQNYQIYENDKPIKSIKFKIEKTSKKKSYIDYTTKKVRRNSKVHLTNKNLNLSKEIKESVKYVKNSKKTGITFISNTNSSICIFGYSPFVPIQKIPKSLFLQLKFPFFIVKKTTQTIFHALIESKDIFEYVLNLIYLLSTLFFYLHVRKNSKNVAFILKRGPPDDY